MTTISNTAALDAQRKDFFNTATKLGGANAIGNDAKMKLAIAAARAARDGIIDEQDAAATYQSYVAGFSSKAMHEHSVQGEKSNVSKLRQIINAAALPSVDFAHTIEADIVGLRDNLKGNTDVKLKPAFDATVDAARLQLKQPDTALDAEQIHAVCVKAEPVEKDLIAKLGETYKRLHKHNDDLEGNRKIDMAMGAVAELIAELGGEVPPVTKDDKKAAAAIAFLRSVGRAA